MPLRPYINIDFSRLSGILVLRESTEKPMFFGLKTIKKRWFLGLFLMEVKGK